MLRSTRIVMATLVSVAVAAAAALPVTAAVAAPRSVRPAACVTHWGTGAKARAHPETSRTARVATARAGKHACFERLVIDLTRGTSPGYRVQYVRAVHAEGSGKLIRLRGHAALQITLHANAARKFPAPGHGLTSVAGFHVLRQVASAGSFEGYTEIGVGLRAKEPFRVFQLKGPGSMSRLVIDVATS
jgi:hypothetical protein